MMFPQNFPWHSPTGSRQETLELIRSQLQSRLDRENFQGAKQVLLPLHPVDVAEAIEKLPKGMQVIAFRLLPKDKAIAVYEYLDSTVQQALIEDFKRQDAIDIVDKMSPDDRARLFDELPAKVVRRLIAQLSPTERQATTQLLGYKPDTAGRIMTPEYISLKENMTVARSLARIRALAIERVRTLARVKETIYYLYVTDAARHLTGVLSLRELVTAQPEQEVGEIATRDVVFVCTDTDREEVARTIQHYDLVAVPVVDCDGRLVGIVTVDDAIDVMEAEATEDIYTLGGVEAAGDSYFRANLMSIARRRVVWLLVLLVANTATSAVIRAQEDVLEQVVVLAAFIPLLIDTGGNVGAQSSTVVIRGLSLDEIHLNKAWATIAREAAAGIMLGLMLGAIAIAWAYLWEGDIAVAITVGVSLWAISLIASISGSALPMLFSILKLDPALMSAPFITTAVDVLGVTIYLTATRLILISS